jgi:PAS domain S-box-containing protein
MDKNKANDLFLLMLTLSQLSSKEKIITVFMDSIQEIWPDLKAKFQNSPQGEPENLINIATSGSKFGNVSINNLSELENNDLGLLQNACGMLAVLLKKNEQEQLLANDQLLLRKLVEEKTENLNREIEEHKRTEDSLRMANERFRHFVNSNIVGIITANSEGIILDTNDYYLNMIGYTRQEFLEGKVNWRQITPTEWIFSDEKAISELKESGTCTPYEKEYLKRDGTRVSVFLADTLLPGPEPLIGALVLDITDRKKAEEVAHKNESETRHLLEIAEKSRMALLSVVEDEIKARQKIKALNDDLEQRIIERTSQLANANKELEAFSYSVSHDLRAPLRALDGFSKILSEDYSSLLDAEGNRLLNVITDSAKKMGNLIDDLLSFSRYSRLEIKLSKIDMFSMVNTIYLDLTSDKEKEKIQFSLQTIPEAYGDPSMVRQVWVNLIGNAIKFSSHIANPVIEVGNYSDVGENIYYIKDNGAGFDMAYSNKLFGVFQRLHAAKDFEGTGVGLAIVQRVILRLKGRVWAEGKVNEGAAFYFTLPQNP